MRTITEICKLLISAVNFLAVTLAVCLLFGEEAPEAHLTLLEFAGIKFGSLLALYLLYKGFLWRGKHNLLPAIIVPDYKELVNPESDADGA